VLTREPNHPGANHYYIHAVEGSRHPERALQAAERLPSLMPGAGHIVHMPSHIYMRTGDYNHAASANVAAIAADKSYIELCRPSGMYPLMYYPHNIDFLFAASSMAGRSTDAIAAAREVAALAPPEAIKEMPMIEFLAPKPIFALARFGKWDEILALEQPPAGLDYTIGMWHYARGVALIRKGRIDAALSEAARLARIKEAMPLDRLFIQNSAKSLLAIADMVLAGEIANAKGHHDRAIADFESAIEMQDDLKYTEPPDWYYPVRESLGQALLEAGKPREAEAVFRTDLEWNPSNGWSLYGLAQSLQAQGRRTDADQAKARFRQSWAAADVTLTAARF
jgi:tetratricopeptide (TPR) repeat protein